MDVAQIKAFAGQFDPQPYHLDDATAKETLFAGLAASGWHTAAITMRAFWSMVPRLPAASLVAAAAGEQRRSNGVCPYAGPAAEFPSAWGGT